MPWRDVRLENSNGHEGIYCSDRAVGLEKERIDRAASGRDEPFTHHVPQTEIEPPIDWKSRRIKTEFNFSAALIGRACPCVSLIILLDQVHCGAACGNLDNLLVGRNKISLLCDGEST